MKKQISLILAVLLTLSLLTACTSMPGQGDGTPAPPIDSYDTERHFPVESAEEESNTVATGFTVKEKLYDFKGENVLIFHVSNESAQNYTLKLRVTYRDENGKAVDKKVQTVRGFAAGHEKYLMFRPGEEFETYTYTLEAEPFEGECLDQLFSATYAYIDECFSYPMPVPDGFDMGKKYPGLRLYMNFSFTGTKEVKITTTYVLLDKNGEIYDIFPLGSTTTYDSPMEEPVTAVVMEFDFTTENKVIWPEKLQGDGVNCICVYTVE